MKLAKKMHELVKPKSSSCNTDFFKREISRRMDYVSRCNFNSDIEPNAYGFSVSFQIIALIFLFRRYWRNIEDEIDYKRFYRLEREDVEVKKPKVKRKGGKKKQKASDLNKKKEQTPNAEKLLDFHLHFYHEDPFFVRQIFGKWNCLWSVSKRAGSAVNIKKPVPVDVRVHPLRVCISFTGFLL